MATRYLELGADVYICGRRKSVLDETAKELMDMHGGSVKSISCDIKVPEAIEDMVNEIWSEGPLTGLLNNAAGNFIREQKIYLQEHLLLFLILFSMELFI